MAKIKPAKRSAAVTAPIAGWTKAVPCLVVLVVGFALMAFLFYSVVTSSVK